jgi:hypothetical protein
VWPSSEALFFFGHLLSRFNLLETSTSRQAPTTAVSSPIDLNDALEALLGTTSRRPSEQLDGEF